MAGFAQLGEHNIVPNYFEQNQAEALDLNLNVLETLVQVGVWCGGWGGEGRGVLGTGLIWLGCLTEDLQNVLSAGYILFCKNAVHTAGDLQGVATLL